MATTVKFGRDIVLERMYADQLQLRKDMQVSPDTMEMMEVLEKHSIKPPSFAITPDEFGQAKIEGDAVTMSNGKQFHFPKELPRLVKPSKALAEDSIFEGPHKDKYKEYRKTCIEIGLPVPDMYKVEEFKSYLRRADFPVYHLKSVIQYMDLMVKDAQTTSAFKSGWQWFALRSEDNLNLRFGNESQTDRYGRILQAGSDFFGGARYGNYSREVPLHALQKVAKIEKEFGKGKVAFMVTDYAVPRNIEPDPFLMAVVPNSKVHEGYGRFVIDFWDEPGFGLDLQLKTDL